MSLHRNGSHTASAVEASGGITDSLAPVLAAALRRSGGSGHQTRVLLDLGGLVLLLRSLGSLGLGSGSLLGLGLILLGKRLEVGLALAEAGDGGRAVVRGDGELHADLSKKHEGLQRVVELDGAGLLLGTGLLALLALGLLERSVRDFLLDTRGLANSLAERNGGRVESGRRSRRGLRSLGKVGLAVSRQLVAVEDLLPPRVRGLLDVTGLVILLGALRSTLLALLLALEVLNLVLLAFVLAELTLVLTPLVGSLAVFVLDLADLLALRLDLAVAFFLLLEELRNVGCGRLALLAHCIELRGHFLLLGAELGDLSRLSLDSLLEVLGVRLATARSRGAVLLLHAGNLAHLLARLLKHLDLRDESLFFLDGHGGGRDLEFDVADALIDFGNRVEFGRL
mmetsp:Transcript_30401/g.71418  ORF Transcript_30401/g.71418 Transcript_30401/m.71418 type:complete len:397 (+) Transcript_30401:51-1241(+)